jgi:UDP-N-acetylmuramoylalanine--D-glutamate ligase
VGGNIGTAMCSLVETSTAKTINVIEVSSFQLDAIVHFRPRVAALLNVTPDHLDRYPDFAAYRKSKFRIFKNQSETDIAVLNHDDPNVYPPPEVYGLVSFCSAVTDGVSEGAFRFGGMLYLNGRAVMAASDVRLRGEHNIENVLASLAITSNYSVPTATLTAVISEFQGVDIALNLLAGPGVDFFNDSKATNVDSAIKAVSSFERNIILILGGRDKGASYDPLVKAMEGKVKHVLLIGEAAHKIAMAIGTRIPLTHVPTLEDAVRRALSTGSAGGCGPAVAAMLEFRHV